MRIFLLDPNLFIKKALVLFIATIALVPLIHYKLMVPAVIYIGALLLLHIFFFYLYFSRVPWKQLVKDKKGLALRIMGIAFFVYLLMLIKFEGSTISILINLGAAFVIHLGILLLLMVVKVEFGRMRVEN